MCIYELIIKFDLRYYAAFWPQTTSSTRYLLLTSLYQSRKVNDVVFVC